MKKTSDCRRVMLALVATVWCAALLCLCGCEPRGKAKDATWQVPDAADVVMYQVNPRVFAPQQSLRAVTARLDSIRDLGVNVVWVMPIYPIGEEKSKNSPYSIRDYGAVAPEFGTIDDLRTLVDECHRRGMCLIMDWVANHTAWDHAWVKNHPEWYTHDSLGNIVFPPGTDWTDVADLNYDNRDLRTAMIAAMRYWVDSVGIDGFRCDVADAVPADFWKEAITQLRAAAQPRRLLMLAEGNSPETFTAGFDMNYAWQYLHALERVFAQGDNVRLLAETDSTEYAGMPRGKVKLRFTTNHDEATKASPVALYGNVRGSMAAFVAATMLHGGMLVYGSQEVGYPETINFFHYVPVDWSANAALRSEYQQLIAVYQAHPALRGNGSVKVYADERGDVLMVERQLQDDRVLVLVNTRNHPADVALPAAWRDGQVQSLAASDADSTASNVLPPYGYRLLTLKK